jgi:hypothetical protein
MIALTNLGSDLFITRPPQDPPDYPPFRLPRPHRGKGWGEGVLGASEAHCAICVSANSLPQGEGETRTAFVPGSGAAWHRDSCDFVERADENSRQSGLGLLNRHKAPPLPDSLLRFQRRRGSRTAPRVWNHSYDPGAHISHRTLPRVPSPHRVGRGWPKAGRGELHRFTDGTAPLLFSPLPRGEDFVSLYFRKSRFGGTP